MVTPSGLVVLTDRRLCAGDSSPERALVPVVRAAVRGGASWVVLREKDLARTRRASLFRALAEVVPAGRLIVAGPDPLDGDAVHLAEADPRPDGFRMAGVRLAGRSCHGPVTESDVDYVTLSPIYPTATKPGYGPALGPVRAAALAGGVPWLALGGVDTPERAASCARAGAAGIAVLGAIMRAPDPEGVARALTEAFVRGKSDISDRADRIGASW